MNKKLIASAMGLVMAGGMGLASADVKLYGQIDLSLNAVDSDVPGFQDDINMGSNTSAVGVKGSEDLGNGMSAFFKLEYQTDPTEGSSLSGRDQYIGLKMESFGKVTFGTTSTAYKSQGAKIDAFYRTSAQARDWGFQSNLHSGKGEEGQGRGTNIVRYDSPSFSGFSVTGTYQFDSDKQDANVNCNVSPTPAACEDDDPYSIGVQYSGGGLYAAAAYIDTQQDDDAAAAQFIAKYSFGDFEVHGIYELDKGLITAHRNNGIGSNLGRNGSADDDGADIWSIGGTYTIGNNIIGVDYAQGDDSDGVDGTSGVVAGDTADDIEDYDSWRIVGAHMFSKRTMVYGGYVNQDYDQKGEDEVFTLGMRHKF